MKHNKAVFCGIAFTALSLISFLIPAYSLGAPPTKEQIEQQKVDISQPKAEK